MRTKQNIEKDIAAAEKTAQDALTTLEKIESTLIELKAKVGLGGSASDLQNVISNKAGEEFKQAAAHETLAALNHELEEFQNNQDREDRLKSHAGTIAQAKKDAESLRKRRVAIMTAMDVLNEVSDEVAIDFLPPATAHFEQRYCSVTGHKLHSSSMKSPGEIRRRRLEEAFDDHIEKLEDLAAMTPEEMEEIYGQ